MGANLYKVLSRSIIGMPFIFRPGGTNRPLLKQIPYYTAFSPRLVGGCSLWLDGNDPAGTGARPSNGTTLTTWVDKSGSGYSTTSGNGVFIHSIKMAMV